jgi:hypothetical protein
VFDVLFDVSRALPATRSGGSCTHVTRLPSSPLSNFSTQHPVHHQNIITTLNKRHSTTPLTYHQMQEGDKSDGTSLSCVLAWLPFPPA